MIEANRLNLLVNIYKNRKIIHLNLKKHSYIKCSTSTLGNKSSDIISRSLFNINDMQI